MTKILIIRFSSIGDIVLTTPVIRCLKTQLKDVEIHFITKEENGQILSANPYIDKLLFLKSNLWDTIKELRSERYDYVIDLHHNQRTWLIKRLLWVKSYSFPKINFQKWLMVNFKINRLPNKHIVDRYFETVEKLGVTNDQRGLDFFVLPENNTVLSITEPYITWAIGAKQNTKQLPEHKIIEAIASANFPKIKVVLLGGKEDEAKANRIMASLPTNALVSYVGKCNLQQSATIVQHALLLITNDTGLMHIGAALKKPIVSVWGNTIPAFGMTPYYGTPTISNQCVENNSLSCRPCSKLGFATCPKQHFLCMEAIDANSIVSAIQALLQ